jgi:effector-binding domain-containing protein
MWAGLWAALMWAGVAAAGELLPPGVSEDTLAAAPAQVALPAQPIAFVRLKTVRNTPEATDLISSTFKRIWAYAKAHGLKVAGSPMEIMSAYQEADGSWHLSAAIPLEAAPASALGDSGDIMFGSIGGGAAVQAAHRGDHARIADTHGRIAAYIAARGLTARGRIVEQHFDNPHTVAPEKLRSAVTYFLE